MLSLSNISKSFGTQTALHPTTLRWNAGAVIGVIGAAGAGKTTLLRILAAQIRPDTGALWMNITPDASRAYVQEPIELNRNRAKWLRHTTFIPTELTGIQKFRYGTPKNMLAKAGEQHPALLLIDEPFRNTHSSEEPLFRDLLATRRKKGLLTIVSDSDIKEIALFDYLVLLHTGKIITTDTPQGFLKKFSGPILAIRTQDMGRLERDLHTFEGASHFYVHGADIRLQLDSGTTIVTAAGAGFSVMGITAWLALRDHQQITVRPVAPILSDFLPMER